MGQHCSCMEQSRKYQRRHSDDVDTMDMERGDEDDGDQEMEILVGHDHEQEMQEVFGTRIIVQRHCFHQKNWSKLLRSYQEATGVVDEGQLELECIMCLDTFSQDNPKIRTLCNCGMNRTNFHMSCLFEWLNREANCPVCREYLFFED
ncbi:unnamed protein product [Peronospora effusa]|nr:unnamed protein product [Peronospora effusa]